MFNCYVHGWSSREYACRMCFPLEVTNSSSIIFIYPETIVGASSEELSRLREENKAFRELAERATTAGEKLAAENARLREALQAIADGNVSSSLSPTMAEAYRNCARMALEGEE